LLTVLAAAILVAASSPAWVERAGAQATGYAVDPLWPQPLPAGWILGSVTGVAVDARNHVWIAHRGGPSLTARTENGLGTDPKTAETCCQPAPHVLEFDPGGRLVSSWGGPGQGYDWPQAPGGIAVDGEGNVWIAAAGAPAPAGRGGRGGRGAREGGPPPPPPPPEDAHVLKFAQNGRFLMQIGKAGSVGTMDSRDALNRPSNLHVDGGELFVADTGSSRVVVFDAATGAYKRHWGGHGQPFQHVSCASVSADGLVYVCDRAANRIQVFRRDGTFVKEAQVAPETRGSGAVWDVAFSADRGQARLFVADGQNQKVWNLNRDTLAVAGSVGAGGRWPGHFYAVGSVAVDSQGHLYTGETLEGKRVQKFVAGR
jgi:sugar lactone lactonase YvrE